MGKGFPYNAFDYLDNKLKTEKNDLEQAADDWVPVELELVDRMWIPDAEILKLKGFRWQR